MDENIIKEMVRVQKQVSSLLENEGICAIADYVQVTEQLFKELVDYTGEDVKFDKRSDSEYPYQASIWIDGTWFFTIGTRSELEAVGLM